MKSFGFRGKGQLERELRAQRPAPRADFLLELSNEVLRSRGTQRRAWSRVAFALAVTTFVIGSFASFGGLSYAASGASSAVTAVKHAVSAHGIGIHKRSAAIAQYGAPKAPANVKPASETQAANAVAQVASQSQLPFTGFSLALTAAIGLALLLIGIALRRVERRQE